MRLVFLSPSAHLPGYPSAWVSRSLLGTPSGLEAFTHCGLLPARAPSSKAVMICHIGVQCSVRVLVAPFGPFWQQADSRWRPSSNQKGHARAHGSNLPPAGPLLGARHLRRDSSVLVSSCPRYLTSADTHLTSPPDLWVPEASVMSGLAPCAAPLARGRAAGAAFVPPTALLRLETHVAPVDAGCTCIHAHTRTYARARGARRPTAGAPS